MHPSERFVKGPFLRLMVVLVPAFLLGACGGAEAPAPESEPAPMSTPATPRVFFIQPQDGATVKSPVHFEFGSEGITIAAVPQGTVETPRPGMVHHHLGVDTDCLPAGEIVQRAEPWIHFGDAKTVIDMQLAPGPHRFALQAGDDQHRTMAGLCSTISVTVAE